MDSDDWIFEADAEHLLYHMNQRLSGVSPFHEALDAVLHAYRENRPRNWKITNALVDPNSGDFTGLIGEGTGEYSFKTINITPEHWTNLYP